MSVPQVLLDRYQLVRRVAVGGMGAIYEGHDLQLGRRVAVKLIHAAQASDPDMRARFLREAKAAAAIPSPNVVQILDVGADEGTLFIVMEWLEGEDLRSLLKREGPRSPQVTLEILKPLGRALRKAHEHHILHRDLKPANVYLARFDGEIVVKLLDFGIAKAIGVGADHTSTNSLVGSIPYVSPEQARGSKEIDHRSDLWSLGVVLFCCLTNSYPFPAASDTDMLIRIVSEEPQLASQANPALGTAFDAFFTRAFQRNAAMRFQSVNELVEAFQAIVVRAPPEAPASLKFAILDPVTGQDPSTGPSTSGLRLPPEPATTSSISFGAAERARPRRGGLIAIVIGATVIVGASAIGAVVALTQRSTSSRNAPSEEPAHAETGTTTTVGSSPPAQASATAVVTTSSAAPTTSTLTTASVAASAKKPTPTAAGSSTSKTKPRPTASGKPTSRCTTLDCYD